MKRRARALALTLVLALLPTGCRTVAPEYWSGFLMDQSFRLVKSGPYGTALAVLAFPFAFLGELFLFPGELMHDAVVILSPGGVPPAWLEMPMDWIPNSQNEVYLQGMRRTRLWDGSIHPPLPK